MLGDIPRDRWDRPLIVPPSGGKRVPYQRVTTLAKMLDDQHNLTKWSARMVAIGLADRPDLLLAASAHRDDKDELNKITEKAKEAAKAGAAATTGTALHTLTERIDRGEELPALPEVYARDLAVYREATAGLQVREIEKFCVNDTLQVGGTTDRIYEIDGQRYIADTKTGSRIDYGIGSIAIQLAVYSRAWGYDPQTDERHALNVNQQWGIVTHLPSGMGRCTLHWINLEQGWYGAQLAALVRDFRKLKMKDLTVQVDQERKAA